MRFIDKKAENTDKFEFTVLSSTNNNLQENDKIEISLKTLENVIQKGTKLNKAFFEELADPFSQQPVGYWMFWHFQELPKNGKWAWCNTTIPSELTETIDIFRNMYGTNGKTPDWKGRVPVVKNNLQSEFNTLNKIGGEIKHRLTLAEMPQHEHNITNKANPSYTGASDVGNGGQGWGGIMPFTGGNSTDTFLTTQSGGDEPHNNLQPYFVTDIIFKIKE